MQRLSPHATTPATTWRVHAGVRRWICGAFRLRWRIEGAIDRLALPPAGPTRGGDRLWEHTCCEAFVQCEGETGYHELNLAPSGEWAIYAFRAYRERVPFEVETSPRVVVRRTPAAVELDATMQLGWLSPAHRTATLRIGFSAVVEDRLGRIAYCALAHPRERPDFHHPDGFTLRLDPATAMAEGQP